MCYELSFYFYFQNIFKINNLIKLQNYKITKSPNYILKTQ